MEHRYEFVSYPFPSETNDTDINIMARTAPGQPTSMIELTIPTDVVSNIRDKEVDY